MTIVLRGASRADVPGIQRVRHAVREKRLVSRVISDDPAHEGRGHGRRLHDAMMAWLWSRGVKRAWLTTAARTRAERFYEKAGWRRFGADSSGEALFEMHAPK